MVMHPIKPSEKQMDFKFSCYFSKIPNLASLG
jgi:hypothetical protein